MQSTTKYIILSKDDRDALQNNDNNQVFFVNRSPTYLLPAVNHDYYVKHGLFENALIEWCKQFCKKIKNNNKDMITPNTQLNRSIIKL